MIPLPAYVDPDAWAGFVEMRKKIKAPMTTRAAHLILRDLQQIKDAGHDANAALDQSTLLGWRGVWPAKEKQIERAPGAVTQEYDEFNKRQREAQAASQTPEAIEARRRAVQSIKRVA